MLIDQKEHSVTVVDSRRNEPGRDLVTHPTWMEIDLEALAFNYGEVRRLVGPETQIIASVKGNGYGVGIVESVRVLHRLGVYAVAMGAFKDAVAVRDAGIDVKIQLFPGTLPDGIPDLLRYDLIPTVCNRETAEVVSRCAEKPTSVFIKVDSGLARLGVPIEEAEAFVKEVMSLPNVVVEGLFTHLPYSDADGMEWSLEHIARFDDLVTRLEASGISIPVTQCVASSGVVCRVRSLCNTVCTGHLLFGGLARVTPDLADISNFRPVLATLKTRLIHIERHGTDKAIGGGGKQSLRAGSITGVIPFGLYDGYLPPASGKTVEMLIRSVRMPVLNVSQEFAVLDLTPLGDPELGEEVTVIGEGGNQRISIEEFAASLGVSPLNVLMSLSHRIPAVYRGMAS